MAGNIYMSLWCPLSNYKPTYVPQYRRPHKARPHLIEFVDVLFVSHEFHLGILQVELIVAGEDERKREGED
jgi:hypothetical protein